MAQDEGPGDASHDLDMVSLFSSENIDAEMETDMIRGVLEANGIPCIVVRAAGFPSLGYEVRVPGASAEEAERLIAEARAAGPEAAAAGEAASEDEK